MKKIFFIITLALCALQVNVKAQTLIAHYPLNSTAGGIDVTGNYSNCAFQWNGTAPDTLLINGACLNGISRNDPGGQLLTTPEITGLDTNRFQVSFDFTVSSASPLSYIMSMSYASGPIIFYSFNGYAGLAYFNYQSNQPTFVDSQTPIVYGQSYTALIKHLGDTLQLILDGNILLTVNTGQLAFTYYYNNSTLAGTFNRFMFNPGNGGFGGCVQNLRVSNNTVVITNPPRDTTVASAGNCGRVVNYPTPSAIGNGPITWTYSIPSGSFFTVGTHTVTATATSSNASASHDFTVTVTDNDPPQFTYCPPALTLNPLPNSCNSGIVSLFNAMATDCNGNPATVTNNAPTIFPMGTTVVTWTATSGTGTTTCTQNVTVQDNILPTLTCGGNITATAPSGQCTAVVTFPNPTITDCCILPTGPIAGFPGMTYIGTFQNHSYYKNTTLSNASNSYSQAVSAGGYLAAINSAAENAFLEAAAGSTSYWIGGYQNTNNPGYSEPNGGWEWLTGEPFTYTNWGPAQPDNSGGIENNLIFSSASGLWYDFDYNFISESIVEFECTGTPVVTTGNPSGSIFPIGTSTVTWQATDRSGNVGTCSFTVTVTDTDPPVIACPANITVNAPAGSCQQLVNYAIPLVTDKCTPAPTSVVGLNYLGSYGGHTYFTIGTTNTWSGANAAAISFGGSLVSINDAGENAFLQSVLPAFGNFWIGGFQNHASGSYAEPSGGWEWLDGSNFNAYTNWAAGQPDNGFGVEDNLIYNASNGTWFDNYTNNTFVQAIVEFSSSIVPVLIAGQPSGSVFNSGTTTITYTATDISGNSDTCSFTITVIGTSVNAKINVAKSITCNGDCDGGLGAKALNGTAPYSYLWNTGSTNRKIENLCSNSYTVTVSDANGCSVVVSKLLCQPKPLKVTCVKTPISSHNVNDGSIIFTVSGGTAPYSYLWNDGYTSESRANISKGLYTITITDAHGCSKTVLKNWTNPRIGTRLQNNTDENFISVFPNPSDGIFTINFETELQSQFNIEVTDLQGRLVYKTQTRFEVDNNQFILDLKNMQKGIYLLKISNDDFNEMQKLVVE